MLLPGTFLGVWNLLKITNQRAVATISDTWIQAHGVAQVFGWVGSFILGIGMYSIPKVRRTEPTSLTLAWTCWAIWTAAIGLRWWTNVYLTDWRVLLPLSAVMQLGAFVLFLRMVSGHRMQGAETQRLDGWIWVVIVGSTGFLLALAVNLEGAIRQAWAGTSPAFAHVFDQRYLALITWGMLVPFVWGFSAKWMPIFLGIPKPRARLLLTAAVASLAGAGLTFTGWTKPAMVIFLCAAALAIHALRILEFPQREPKTKGVHASFPLFVRLAYAWLVAAAGLGVYAAYFDHSGGVWGASRHALTVGFIAVTVFCVGQRVLPSFAGMTVLYSTRLMLAGLIMLNVGCLLRVSSEFLAYQDYAAWAWRVLPVSAVIELAAVTIFALNLGLTFAFRRQESNTPLTIPTAQVRTGQS